MNLAKPTETSVQQTKSQQRAFGDPLRALSYALLAECYARGSHGLAKDETIAMQYAKKAVALERFVFFFFNLYFSFPNRKENYVCLSVS